MRIVLLALSFSAFLMNIVGGSVAQVTTSASTPLSVITNVLGKEVEGQTELMKAAQEGSTRRVKELISAGADLKLKDKDGNTALMYASSVGYLECVKALVAAGADVKAKNNHDDTALMYVAYAGFSESLQALITAGADLNTRNKAGKSAIILASERHNSNCVDALIAAGAAVTVTTSTSHRPKRILTSNQQVAANKPLLRIWKYTHEFDGNGTFHLFHFYGDLDAVNKALEGGADPNVRSDYSDELREITPLIMASDTGPVSVVACLLEHGADPNATFDEGFAALNVAARADHASIVKLLLHAGASTEVLRDGCALLYSASAGYADVVKLLLQAGAKTDVRFQEDEYHYFVGKEITFTIHATPLIQAAHDGYADVVRLLLQFGADKEAKDYFGYTALEYAVRLGKTRVVRLLLAAHANIESQDGSHLTPLMEAARSGQIDIVKLLLEAGADKQAKVGGKTALSVALSNHNWAVAHLLKTAGAR